MTQMVWQATHHPHADDATAQQGALIALPDDASLARPSPDLDRLLEAIQSHEITEIDAVRFYRDLARETSDPVVGSLLRMLVDDEEHHHRVLRAISMNLRAALSGDRDARMPPRDVPATAIDPLRKFARQERDGAAALRTLAGEAPDLFGGLFSLLLNLIALDGEKHQLILQFVVQELEAARSVERDVA